MCVPASENPSKSIKTIVELRHSLPYNVIDSLLNELEDRFPQQSSALLERLAYLNPTMLLSPGRVPNILALAAMYPCDFPQYEVSLVERQLKNFLLGFSMNPLLKQITSLPELVVKMTYLKQSISYPLVFRLIRLALTLPLSVPLHLNVLFRP